MGVLNTNSKPMEVALLTGYIISELQRSEFNVGSTFAIMGRPGQMKL